MTQAASELSPEEEAALDGKVAIPPKPEPERVAIPDDDEAQPWEHKPDVGAPAVGPPPWVKVPKGLKFPPNNRQIYFMLFKAEWTDTPEKGDRQCIVWNLTAKDEHWALQRVPNGLNEVPRQQRTTEELSMACIRAIDGEIADWSRDPTKKGASVSDWWNDIGAQCRGMIKSHYIVTHVMNEAAKIDFLSNCLAAMTSRG